MSQEPNIAEKCVSECKYSILIYSSDLIYKQRRIEQQAACHDLQRRYTEALQQCEKWILQTSLQVASLETASASTYEAAVQQTNSLKVCHSARNTSEFDLIAAKF